MQPNIQKFLSGNRFAVVGASSDRNKYGNKVLRCYLQDGREAIPVNPGATEIESIQAVPDLAAIQPPVDAVSIITPPEITHGIVQQIIDMGIPNVWMQPGSADDETIQLAQDAGLNVVAGGPCLLVELSFEENEEPA